MQRRAILQKILCLKSHTVQTLRCPRAAEAAAVGGSSGVALATDDAGAVQIDSTAKLKRGLALSLMPVSPFGAERCGCAASGRFPVLGRGCRSRGHQSDSPISNVNCSKKMALKAKARQGPARAHVFRQNVANGV